MVKSLHKNRSVTQRTKSGSLVNHYTKTGPRVNHCTKTGSTVNHCTKTGPVVNHCKETGLRGKSLYKYRPSDKSLVKDRASVNEWTATDPVVYHFTDASSVINGRKHTIEIRCVAHMKACFFFVFLLSFLNKEKRRK